VPTLLTEKMLYHHWYLRELARGGESAIMLRYSSRRPSIIATDFVPNGTGETMFQLSYEHQRQVLTATMQTLLVFWDIRSSEKPCGVAEHPIDHIV
jgi:hypothetical protein